MKIRCWLFGHRWDITCETGTGHYMWCSHCGEKRECFSWQVRELVRNEIENKREKSE